MGILDSLGLSGGDGSLLGGVAGALGSVTGGVLANSASAASVSQQENFQAQMADTTYQRTVADMEAAGLNPMLAYGNSLDATPGGASYTAQNVASGAVNSGVSAASVNADVSNTESQTDLNQAQLSKVAADTKASNASAAQANANAAATLASIPLKTLENTPARAANAIISNINNSAYTNAVTDAGHAARRSFDSFFGN